MRIDSLLVQLPPETLAHGMKLEKEVNNSLYLFTSAERPAEKDCGAKSLTAQGTSALASIDSPKQLTSSLAPPELPSPGCGCGSTDEESRTLETKLLCSLEPDLNPTFDAELIACRPLLVLSSFACKHIRFIDEDVEETESSAPESFLDGSASHKDTNAGIFMESSCCVPNGDSVVSNRHFSDYSSKTLPVEVSDSVSILLPKPPHKITSCSEFKVNGMSVIENEATEKTNALRRQNSLDDSRNEEISNSSNVKHLKSALKKGKSSEKHGKKSRVTFDEAVTLYSDEFEDVQLLALRSAAEVNYAEVFYMFEPPIEYQDLLPFEPPAEYRDPEEKKSKEYQSDDTKQAAIETTKEVVQDLSIQDNADTVAEENIKDENQSTETEKKEDIDLSVTVPLADGDDVTVAQETGKTEDDLHDNVLESQDLQIGISEESEKLFQRFLEAEREFAEDEELNRVFHVLENDLIGDSRNGTFDDNFFKKLINLLSSVEGEVRLEDGDFFSSTDFTINEEIFCRNTDDDNIDSEQSRSRTISEADSDCSGSSQDTIIVRLGDEVINDGIHEELHRAVSLECDLSTNELSVQEPFQNNSANPQENCDDVFSETSKLNLENCHQKNSDCVFLKSNENEIKTQVIKTENTNSSSNENLSRQNSGDQVSKIPSQEAVQDADDSTSSDSRSGEVEEEIRLDDIGYDEEDADDYDEECLRGMAHGNSKIRRIIKKNALQCTLLRNIEARRRQTGGKYPRPKSPLLSEESLVEQIKWLTAVDENKDTENFSSSSSKPPDVILSTGAMRLNGNIPQNASSEEDINNRGITRHRLPTCHPHPQKHLIATNSDGVYIVRQGAYPPAQHSRPVRQWIPPSNYHVPVLQHQRPYYSSPHCQLIQHTSTQQQQIDERVIGQVRMPKDFRDWRVIQRVMVNRSTSGNDSNVQYKVPVSYRQRSNGEVNSYPRNVPVESERPFNKGDGNDELEQFVQQDSQRIERIRKRYSLAEDEDDPTFGFARRPSVRVVQNQSLNQHQPSDQLAGASSGIKCMPVHTNSGVSGQGPIIIRNRMPSQNFIQDATWNRNPNFKPIDPGCAPAYYSSGAALKPQTSMHIHRASVALTELPGSATLPHPKSHTDTRYHSYAESVYGGSQTLPHKRWISADLRTYVAPINLAANHQVSLQIPLLPPTVPPPPALQVPSHAQSTTISDERGVPEGASSSPKVSSDSLYHAPVPETLPVGAAHNEDGVIYYSLNV